MPNTARNLPFLLRGFTSSKPAQRWEEALPSGNGKMGALVMSESTDETIVLSHEKLYLPVFGHRPQCPDVSDSLPELRQILKQGRYKDLDDYFAKLAREAIEKGIRVDQKFGPDPFHPAFDLKLMMSPKGKVHNYLRWVNFESGEAAVRWSDQRGEFCRRLFVSRPDNVVVLSICPPSGQKVNCQLQLAERRPNHPAEHERIDKHIRNVKITTEDEWISYQARYSNSKGGYEGLARIICLDGAATSNGKNINVENAGEVLIFIRVLPLAYADKSALNSMRSDLANLEADYSTLLDRHAKVHGEIFNRLTLDLGGDPDRGLTTEELISKAQRGDVPVALLEKIHDMGRYVFISSSGQLPPNLQGVWTGTWLTPWAGEYALDANLQLAISSALMGNMAECLEGYFSYIESLLPDWRENARLDFGCRGILSSLVATTNGQQAHGAWTAGAGWLAQTFYDYWLFTGDREFLAKRAVPLMKEIAIFYEDFLVENENGKYVFIPSYSPENTPANTNTAICTNATMDIAVTKELLSNLIAACEELNIDLEGVARWKKMLDKLPEYMVNKDGSLKEWAVLDLQDNNACHHTSHLYPLWPGSEADPDKTPELFKACQKAIQIRNAGQKEAARQSMEKSQKPGGRIGFGVAWLAIAAARLKDGELAFDILSELASQFHYRNLISVACPMGTIYAEYPYDSPIFNIDVNGGLPRLLMEMLVFSRPGFVELLPALPSKLSKGTAGGILCPGRIEIKRLEWDMKVKTIRAVLNAAVDQTLELKIPEKARSLQVTQGNAVVKDSARSRRCYEITLPAAASVKLAIAMR